MAQGPAGRVHFRRRKFYDQLIDEVRVWCEWRFRLQFAGKGKSDTLPFLLELREAGREIRPEDVEPPKDEAVDQYLEIFRDLQRWKPAGMSGPSPLTLDMVELYCKRYGLVLHFWEVQLLKMMDDLFIAAYHEGAE